MAFPKLLDDLKFIQKLGDNPNTDNGLTAAELKAWFDKAPVVIQDYINNVLIAKLDSLAQDVESFAAGTGFLPIKGGAMSGDIAMGGHKVTGLGTPTDASDAVPMSFLIGRTVPVSGGGTGATTADAARTNLGAVNMVNQVVTLSSGSWSGNTQTVSVAGVTSGNTILVGYNPDSYEAFVDAAIRCTSQSDGQLTFACESIPDMDVNVNVVILN
ncbi:MAG: hypothetical protein ACI3VA_07155 [Candidatus Limivicinus sp.]